MLVPGTKRLCRVGLAAVLVTALCALAFVDLPLQLLERLTEPPPTLGGEPVHSTRSVVAYSWTRRLALDYRPLVECPGSGTRSQKDFPIPSPATKWLEALDGLLFIFSAHVDHRIPSYPNVRVIGVRNKLIEESLYCTIWYNEDGLIRSVSMEALTTDIWLEKWGGVSKNYTGILITCPTSNLSLIPLSVTVSESPCNEYPSHSIEVSSKRLKEDDEPTREFTLCIKGLNFDGDISEKVAAFVELNRLLGASKFYFYVFNVHENVIKLLRFLESSNVVRWFNLTLPGSLPNDVDGRRKFLEEEMWLKRKMELIPYNHCFYDSIHDSEYVVPIDLDEAMIPRRRGNWHQMIEEEKIRLGKSFDDFASYAVRNVYFFNELQTRIKRQKLSGVRYFDTLRSKFVSAEGDSVKSFMSTRRALTVHNHYVLRGLDTDNPKVFHFSPEHVLKHHYRTCDDKYFDCEMLMQDVVRDTTALKYLGELVIRTNQVLKNSTLY